MEMQNQTFFEIIIYAISAFSTLIFGHNLWLVAKDQQNEIEIEIVTSDKFPESDMGIKPERVKDFRVFSENDSFEIADFQTSENSLISKIDKIKNTELAALEIYPHPIVLEADKFVRYIKSEEAENFVAPDFIEGETLEPQRESYAKFAKVMFDNQSFARNVGHQFEIVLQENPSEIGEDGVIPVKVLFDGKPIENLRVSSGSENLKGGKYSAHSRTDENGVAKIKISGKGLWFIRTHYIRSHLKRNEFDWESFWASITFRI